MKILLDTHCWLWLQVSPERIPAKLQQRLEDPETELFLSAASSWEIALKHRLGKLSLAEPPERYVLSRLSLHGVIGLPIQHRHALRVAELPLLHRDPFDRLLIAQAMVENLKLASADGRLSAYPDVEVLWA